MTNWSWFVLAFYSVAGTIAFIGYVLYMESRIGTARFECETANMHNAILQRCIDQQQVLLNSSRQYWLRTAGADPLAMTAPHAVAPNTPPPSPRRVRALTKLKAFERFNPIEDRPTTRMPSY